MFDFFDRKNGVFWIAFVCGFYPLVFYCSNNFYAVNSLAHFGYFILFFIGLSLAGFALIELFFYDKKGPSKIPAPRFVHRDNYDHRNFDVVCYQASTSKENISGHTCGKYLVVDQIS